MEKDYCYRRAGGRDFIGIKASVERNMKLIFISIYEISCAVRNGPVK